MFWSYIICKGFWIELPLLRQGNDTLIALKFRRERFCADTCNLVVDASLVIHFGIDPFVTFFYQSSLEHSFERTIECASTHVYLSLRVCFDLLHDAVAMPFSIGECQEDMEDSRCKRWRGICSSHMLTLYPRRI